MQLITFPPLRCDSSPAHRRLTRVSQHLMPQQQQQQQQPPPQPKQHTLGAPAVPSEAPVARKQHQLQRLRAQANGGPKPVGTAAMAGMRLGVIGLDSSHGVGFAEVLNASNPEPQWAG